jgi:predicted ester cyclase
VSAQENEAAVERALAAWNAGDLAGYLELYDEGIRLHGYSPEPMDKQSVRAFYEQVFAAFDSPKLRFHEVFSSGDSLCINFTMTGCHVAEFMGVPATGREIALGGITVLHFRDARCIERWSQVDMLGLLVQLGAVPAPV